MRLARSLFRTVLAVSLSDTVSLFGSIRAAGRLYVLLAMVRPKRTTSPTPCRETHISYVVLVPTPTHIFMAPITYTGVSFRRRPVYYSTTAIFIHDCTAFITGSSCGLQGSNAREGTLRHISDIVVFMVNSHAL